jgi:hypothetical protein
MNEEAVKPGPLGKSREIGTESAAGKLRVVDERQGTGARVEGGDTIQ